MWITNGSIADIAVVWARTDDGIRGFLVPTDTPGFEARTIKGKMSLRASITSELVLSDCRLPGDAILPDAAGLKAPLSCLGEARFGILFGAVGAGRSCYLAALEYAKSREQFDRPIAGFQLTQAKLVDMMLEVNEGAMLALHLGRMKDDGRLLAEHVSGEVLVRASRSTAEVITATVDPALVARQRDLEPVLVRRRPELRSAM
jgi:glutaryl-CoA dehydrogenase